MWLDLFAIFNRVGHNRKSMSCRALAPSQEKGLLK